MLKTITILSTLFAGVSSFGILVPAASRTNTALAAAIAEEDMTTDQLEIAKISQKWSEVRHMDRSDVEALDDPKWLEEYDKFYNKYNEDMDKMTNIVEKIQKQIEPPKVEKKTKGQRKRDKWAKVQARAAAAN